MTTATQQAVTQVKFCRAGMVFPMKADCKLVIVTHNIQQVARAGNFAAFILDGRLIDYDEALHHAC